MANVDYKRRAIKSGDGKATVPPSPSHELGDWEVTDIYEKELYYDAIGKKFYTRIGNNIIELNGKPSFPPAIGFTGCIYAGPPTEDDGDIYILIKDVDSPFMDVDTIAWTTGHTVRYTFNEFSMMTDGSLGVNAYLHVSGATNPVHNGSFKITAFNTGAGWIDVTNSRVESAGSNEASDSPATAYYTQADWDGGKLGDIMQYHLSSNLWEATTPETGQTIINKTDYIQYVFNGTEWAQSGQWTQDATNLSTVYGRNVLPMSSNAQDLGSNTKLWKHLFIGGKIQTETEFRITTERSSPTPDLNNNWAADANPFLGAWTALLTPVYGDLVQSTMTPGDIYQNQTGSNDVMDPEIDFSGNWVLYISGYVGPWNAGAFGLSEAVDYLGFIYTHLSTTQEMYKELYFDGTTFFFRTNLSTFMTLDSSKMTIRRVENAGALVDLSFVSSAGLELKGQYFQLEATVNGVIKVANSLKIGVASSGEIHIQDNTAADKTSDTTDKKAIGIGMYDYTIKQGIVNSVGLGGLVGLVDKSGSVVFGNYTNADSGKLAYYVHTADDTPTEIKINNVYDFPVPANTAYQIALKGIAVIQASGDCVTYSGEALIKNIAGTTTLTMITAITQTLAEGGTGTTALAITADDGADKMVITVTGNAGTDIAWNLVVDYIRLKFT